MSLQFALLKYSLDSLINIIHMKAINYSAADICSRWSYDTDLGYLWEHCLGAKIKSMLETWMSLKCLNICLRPCTKTMFCKQTK